MICSVQSGVKLKNCFVKKMQPDGYFFTHAQELYNTALRGMPTRKDVAQACSNIANACRKLQILLEQQAEQQDESKSTVDAIFEWCKFLNLVLCAVLEKKSPVLQQLHKILKLATTSSAKKCTVMFVTGLLQLVGKALGLLAQVFTSLSNKIHHVQQQQVTMVETESIVTTIN